MPPTPPEPNHPNLMLSCAHSIFACVLLAWLPACGEPSPGPSGVTPGRTNLLLVLLDTTRADHLGAWGYPQDTSPEIDRLAREGVRFSRFHATAPWTRPSMASLLTGLYPRSTGIFEEQFDVLGEDLVTLAERMQADGYLTLGLTSNPNINAWFQFDQGFDEYMDAGALWEWLPGQAEDHQATPTGPLSGEEMTRRTLDMLDRHADALEQQPYFLQTLYIDPHRPYRKHTQRFEGSNAWYDGEIRYMDEQVGLLLEGLTQRGLLEDTLVVVTADHGEGLDSHPGVPVSENHGYQLFQSTLHVPLILWHRDLAPREISVPSSSVDLMPTLADVFGWEGYNGPGRSFAASLGGGALPAPAPLFAETDWRQASKVSVMDAGHRYIRNDDSIAFQTQGTFEGLKPLRALLKLPKHQLFDLGASGFEQPQKTNRWQASPQPSLSLALALEQWLQETPARQPERRSAHDVRTQADGSVVPAVTDGYDQSLDQGMRDQLEALGYMGED